VISLVVARGLYRRAGNWGTYAIVMGCVGGVLLPILGFVQGPFILGVLQTAVTWGLVGALLLLLVGKPPKSRRMAAIGVFLVLTVGVYSFIIVRVLSQ
jgi:hypothetical protein